MKLTDSILAALQSLRVNVMRSVLTTLGIIIGVAAVIIMVSVGAGAQASVDKLIERIGSNLMIILPGSSNRRGVHGGSGSKPTLTEDDAQAIQNEIAGVEVAAPAVRGSGQVIFGNANWFTSIQGITPEYMIARNWTIAAGRAFRPEEMRGAPKIALLGETVVENLFAGEDPVGQIIRIKRVPFTVVGVLAVKGQTPYGRDLDDTLFVPMSTAKKRVLGGNRVSGRFVGNIAVKARSADDVAIVERQVTELIRLRHRIRPGQTDDFSIRNISEFLAAREESSRVMTLLLAAVASVSLLVGGIGIMNIMLVSVTERTREIGLRMAVGAAARDILAQFLIEALTLSLIGGLIGVVLGIAGAQIMAEVAAWPMRLDIRAVFLAFGFSAFVGVFFGYYPARKAARLDPIEALRYE